MYYSQHILLRNVYDVQYIPWLGRLYRYAFDHDSLSNPQIRKGVKTPLRYLVKYLFCKKNKVNYQGKIAKLSVHINDYFCQFKITNTQLHSLYFKRFNPCFEPEVCACIDWIILNYSIDAFYDIGANWGYISGYLASHPDFKGKIYAFEPQLDVYQDLQTLANVFRNKVSFETYQLALSDRKGSGIIVHPDGFHSGLAQIKPQEKVQDEKSSPIQIMRLDDFCGDPPQLIKIDAEYHETAILKGAILKIKKHTPFILLEYWSEQKELLEFIIENNYSIFSLFWQPSSKENAGYGRVLFTPITLERMPYLRKNNIFACHNSKLQSIKSLLNMSDEEESLLDGFS